MMTTVGRPRASSSAKLGTGEDAAPPFAEHFLHDLVGQETAAAFESLAQPQEGRRDPGLGEPLQRGAQPGERGGDQDEVGRLGRQGEIGRQRERIGKGVSREVAAVLGRRLHTSNLLRIACPQGHRMDGGESDGERRTPRAGS
jgi:hypothetical protein